MSNAYYNEFDPYCAQWLRNLIKAGHIAKGVVDERSIEDVHPDELAEFTQCHFFAGVGVWSLALRRAGWPDDRAVWSGSCPCQPFSAAGKGAGVNDERHLWPAFYHLITQCEPDRIYGEQVASKDGLGWLDLVQTDLEGAGYASGATDLCVAGVGAPHIRQRIWFVAERLADSECEQRQRGRSGEEIYQPGAQQRVERLCDAGGLADSHGGQQQGEPVIRGIERDGKNAGRSESSSKPVSHGDVCGLGNTNSQHPRRNTRASIEAEGVSSLRSISDGLGASGDLVRMADSDSAGPQPGQQTAAPTGYGDSIVADGSGVRSGPTNGLWRDADWLHCRDGKWRPVEPGTFPLAHGAASRVGRLRAYGNAINAEAAQAFIESTI